VKPHAVSLAVILTAVSSIAPGLRAQPAQIRLDRITTAQGLSHFSVTSLVQDAYGFLWIGTEDGLNKYDGYAFETFRSIPGDSTSLSHSRILSLLNDRSGRLWVGTGRGLSLYDVEPHSFIRASSWVSVLQVNAMLQDRTGTIWVGTSSGLGKLDPEKHVCEPFAPGGLELNGVSITALREGPDGTLWIGTGSGLHSVDTSRMHVRSHTTSEVTAMTVATDGSLWVGSRAGLSTIETRTAPLVPFGGKLSNGTRLPADMVTTLCTDSKGIIWAGTFNSGMYAVSPQNGHAVLYQHDPRDPQSLDRNRINVIHEDNGGVLWVGTYRGALHRFDRRREAFVHVRPPGSVYAILKDLHNDMWVGSSSEGLWQLPANGGTPIDHTDAVFRRGDEKDVLSLAEGHDGTLWLGTGIGLVRHYPAQRVFRKVDLRPKVTSMPTGVKTILADTSGVLWIGTQGSGLARYNSRNGTVKWFVHDPLDSTSLSNDQVWSIQRDRSGTLWVGTFGGGLNAFNPATSESKRVSDPNYASGSSGIYCVVIDSQERVWMGTFAGGIVMLDQLSGVFSYYTVHDGLPDNFVKSIVEDNAGNMWIATDHGIARLDPLTGGIRRYSSKDVLDWDVFLSGSNFRDETGRLYFGGEQGFISFHPDSLRENATVPQVRVTSFEVFNESYPPGRSILNLDAVRLAHDQNSLSFQFVGLDFANPAGVSYSYRLEGADREWVRAGQRRYATYAHLPPGSYVFKVRAANDDGLVNEDGARLRIDIASPYWATWWFRSLIVATVAFLLYVVYRYRLARILEVEGLRQRIARDLHDDVGTNLSAIVLSTQMMQRRFSLPETVKSELNELREVASRAQDLMRDTVWMLNPENDALSLLLARMKHEASALLKEIPYHFELHDGDADRRIGLVVKRNIFLAYKEALNNVVRHSHATHVHVRIACNTDSLTIEVSDNGRGFDAETIIPGNGLQNMHIRAENIGGRCDIVSAPGSGTTMRLTAKIA